MKKKVVFLSYRFMGYENEIIELMEKEMNFEVFFINFEDYLYKPKNIVEKFINNIFYKPILKKNLKKERFNQNVIRKIEEIGEVDLFFTIRADKFSEEIFQYIRKKNKPMYLHHWDSFSFIEEQRKYLKYFDYISTFDKEEAREYDLKFIPNFYLDKNIINGRESLYEFFTVMKYDKRFPLLEKLGKFLKENFINYKFIVVTEEDIKSDYITIEKNYITLEENYRYISESKGIVEIGHSSQENMPTQGGLSFRIADAIGNRKKIITNYEFIRDYDIYKKENIFILKEEEIHNSKKLMEFIKGEYREYSKEIYENYSGKNWIKKIFVNE